MGIQPTASTHLSESFSSTQQFLTQSEAANLLRLSERTLERHRLSGTGPVFVKLGRRVVYRASDLLAFAQAHTYRSTSEPQA